MRYDVSDTVPRLQRASACTYVYVAPRARAGPRPRPLALRLESHACFALMT